MEENYEALSAQTSPTPHHFLRSAFFILCIIFFLGILLYLMYHNGKSIYDNGV